MNKFRTELGLTIAELTSRKINPLGKSRMSERHPWESWLENLTSRESRRVSRVVMGQIPEDINTETLKNALGEVLKEKTCLIYVKGGRRIISDCPPFVVEGIQTVKGLQEIYDNDISTPPMWMVMGVVVDDAGQKRLMSFGDHLAADGNIHMDITDEVAKKIGVKPMFPNEKTAYIDGSKYVVGKLFQEDKYTTDYTSLLYELCQEMFKTQKFLHASELWISMPIAATINNVTRIIPTPIRFEKGSDLASLRNNIKQVIINTKRNPELSVTASWMALTSEGSDIKQKTFKAIQNMPIIGKPTANQLKGDLLFSVMEAEDYGIASTTITPRPDSLICTVVRGQSKKIKSVTLSGNTNIWSKDQISSLVDTI